MHISWSRTINAVLESKALLSSSIWRGFSMIRYEIDTNLSSVSGSTLWLTFPGFLISADHLRDASKGDAKAGLNTLQVYFITKLSAQSQAFCPPNSSNRGKRFCQKNTCLALEPLRDLLASQGEMCAWKCISPEIINILLQMILHGWIISTGGTVLFVQVWLSLTSRIRLLNLSKSVSNSPMR